MDEFLLFNGPWSKEFSDVLRFWISLLSLAFSLILTVASNLHPYSTDNKTSRLMVHRFSTVRDTQRGSQSYMEKRRGRRERGGQEEKQGSQKERERSSQ